MDSFYLPLMVRRRITFLAKQEYFTGTGVKGRLIAWFYTAVGQVPPIDRTDADSAQDALNTAARILGEGKLLGMYPEAPAPPGRPAVQGQDRAGPAGPADRCAGDPPPSRWSEPTS